MRTILITLIIIFTFLSCKKNTADKTCFKSNGEEITIVRNFNDFNTIKLDDNFNVELINDTTNKIEITTGKNLINNIKTNIDDSILSIKDDNKCRWLRSYKVEKKLKIHFKTLNYLLVNKQCDIYSNDTIFANTLNIIDWGDVGTINLILKCNNFYFTCHAGTGDFTFSGITQNQFLYLHGNGYIHAKNLKSSYCDVSSKTTGNIEILVNNTLIYSLFETGNIIYYGNPANIVEIANYSSGKLIKGN